MMMRADEDYTTASEGCSMNELLACFGSSDITACMAECNGNPEEPEEPTVVKAGDLEITSTATTWRKAIKGAISDLDTLKFKTSEEVSITKITLERYGYSDGADVEWVRLEDSDGNIIAESKTVNSKDQVVLSIKKDYRKVDGNFNATIVLQLKAGVTSSSIGFKVVDVESTAENVKLKDYTPYEYEIVDYTAVSGVTLTDKDATKNYNYEAGEYYQVAKFKLKASNSAVTVNWFTMVNNGSLDLEEFLNGVKVLANGTELKGVNYTVDNDKLTISFDAYELAAKWDVTLTVTIALDDFDEYGTDAKFAIAGTDFRMTEKKTWARVSPTGSVAGTATHAFEGSKIKLTNTKLGNVDAAQGSDDVVVLEWNIELSEAIDKVSFGVFAKNGEGNINTMKLLVAWEEYEATKGRSYTFTAYNPADHTEERANGKAMVIAQDTTTTTVKVVENSTEGFVGNVYIVKDTVLDTSTFYELYTDATTKAGIDVKLTDEAEEAFVFDNVEVEKAGKVKILVDIDDEATQDTVITFKPTINKNVIANGTARYVDAKKPIKVGEVAGSISFATKVTIQASKASLENDLTKNIQFVASETSRKTVFEGTYTAKKGDVYLDTAEIIPAVAYSQADWDLTFYIYVDGNEVANIDAYSTSLEEEFSSVLVRNGKSVSVKVEAEAYPETDGTTYDFDLKLSGKDANDNPAWAASASLVTIEYVDAWSVTISAATTRDTVLLKAKNTTLAEFTVKPSNDQEWLYLDKLNLDITAASATIGDLRLKVNWVEFDPEAPTATTSDYIINEEIPASGLNVQVVLKSEEDGDVVLDVTANGTATKTFTKSYAKALVYIASQTDEGDYTHYTLWVEKYNPDYVVDSLILYTTANYSWTPLTIDGLWTELSDGDEFTIDNTTTTQTIRGIWYDVDDWVTPKTYKFNSSAYADYFKVNGISWRVFSNNK